MGIIALLFLWLIAPVVFALLFVLPLKLMIRGISDLVYLPLQILTIAFNRPLRRNHALEHATINVLERRYGARGLAGLARPSGFLVRGWPDVASLEWAAREALVRLQRGENQLVIHRRCGTSQAAGNILFALLFLTVLLAGGRLDLLTVVFAGLLLLLISPHVGILVQRTLTTADDVDDVVITGVAPVYERRPLTFGFGLALFSGPPGAYFVRTATRRPREMSGRSRVG
ncbi:MAG: DUF6391 domain-containing protein [Bacillota bacterium]